MADRPTDPGSDGYGPPPSEAATQATAAFFDDNNPPPRDPELARQIAERISEREKNLPWKRANQ